MLIKEIYAKEALDSKKDKTIQVLVKTSEGTFSGFSPSGESKGKNEVQSFIKNVEGDIKNLADIKFDFEVNSFKDLANIEEKLKGKVGANTVFATESAILKALAADQGLELWQLLNNSAKRFPMPIGNCIGGGVHAKSLNYLKPDFQEFLVIPQTRKFADAVFLMKKMHENLGKILEERKVRGELDEENAWSTSLGNEEILNILNEVRINLEQETDNKIKIGVDVASSTFYYGKCYNYKNPKKILNSPEQVNYISELVDKFNIFYVEDPLNQEDFDSFRIFRDRNFGRCLVVGDDLTVSNVNRFVTALKNKSINAIILKPNQCGSLIEIKKIVDIAKKLGIVTIMSHRAGETMDYILADLALGFQTEFIKTGILGKEREIKLKRLIDLEARSKI